MRILILGAGAMGSAVGGFMAKAGHQITLVGRKPHMDAIGQSGLHITGIWGEHRVHNIDARTSPEALAPGSFDLIVIAVKSYDTEAAVHSIKRLVGADTLVLSYQNGLGNAETIAQAIGWPNTFGARAIYGVRINQPGQIEITVIAQPTALGVYSPETPAHRVRQIAAAMDAAGLPTVYTDSIATLLWAKVAYNCALNPLSAVLDVPYGDLPKSDHTRNMMREIVFELYAVAKAMGVPLDPETPEGYFELLIDRLIPPTAAHYASMHADLRRRRRTEIDALNGAICRYGRLHNIPTPTNLALTRLMSFFDQIKTSG